MKRMNHFRQVSNCDDAGTGPEKGDPAPEEEAEGAKRNVTKRRTLVA